MYMYKCGKVQYLYFLQFWVAFKKKSIRYY